MKFRKLIELVLVRILLVMGWITFLIMFRSILGSSNTKSENRSTPKRCCEHKNFVFASRTIDRITVSVNIEFWLSSKLHLKISTCKKKSCGRILFKCSLNHSQTCLYSCCNARNNLPHVWIVYLRYIFLPRFAISTCNFVSGSSPESTRSSH